MTDPLQVGKLFSLILIPFQEFPGCNAPCALAFVFVWATELRRAEWKEIDFEDQMWRILTSAIFAVTPPDEMMQEYADYLDTFREKARNAL